MRLKFFCKLLGHRLCSTFSMHIFKCARCGQFLTFDEKSRIVPFNDELRELDLPFTRSDPIK